MKLTRKQAAQIATDLIEGGVHDPLTIAVNLAIWGVSPAQARRVKAVLCKNDVKRSDRWMYEGGRCVIAERDAFCRQSMADAIENGWEDAALGIKS